MFNPFDDTADILDAIGKNDEAQKFKIEQPMVQLPCPPVTYTNEKPDEIYFRDKFKQLCAKLEVDNGELLYMKDAMPILKYLFDDGYDAGLHHKIESENDQFLKGSARGTEAIKRRILTNFDKYLWSALKPEFVLSEVRKLIEDAEVTNVAK